MIARQRRSVKGVQRPPAGRAAGARSDRRARGRGTAAEAARLRKRLLVQAERQFARKGYDGTSLRELARASGVRLFTIQHHFGSKQHLYDEVRRRWDAELEALLSRVLAGAEKPEELVARAVDALFDFFLVNRWRVVLNARAALGERLPRRSPVAYRSWVRFMSSSMARHHLRGAGSSLGLLLITVEGVLHNHVLASAHYRHLFGRDVTDPRVAARVKRHLKRVILALVAGSTASPEPKRRGSRLPPTIAGRREARRQR